MVVKKILLLTVLYFWKIIITEVVYNYHVCHIPIQINYDFYFKAFYNFELIRNIYNAQLKKYYIPLKAISSLKIYGFAIKSFKNINNKL